MFLPLMSLSVAALFFVLTPGVLLSLPKGGSKFVVAATHAAVFGLVFHFTHNALMNLTQYEMFEDAKPTCSPPGKAPAKDGSCCIGSPNASGMC